MTLVKCVHEDEHEMSNAEHNITILSTCFFVLITMGVILNYLDNCKQGAFYTINGQTLRHHNKTHHRQI